MRGTSVFTARRSFSTWSCRTRTCVTPSKNLYRRYSTQTEASGVTDAPTHVEKILLDNIKATGPITFSSYMQFCLSHPTHGYYMNTSNPIFGTQGDFVTSPEISQLFGELVGVWFMYQWMGSERKRGIRLIELGPGRGTLMDDILRTLSRYPSSSAVPKHVHLIETSLPLRSSQQQKLQKTLDSAGVKAEWHESIEDIPEDHGSDLFTMIIAHEFFDALPFHLLEHTSQGWQEILVNSSQNPDHLTAGNSIEQTQSSSRFQTVLSSTPLAKVLSASSPRFHKLPVGARLEVSPAAWNVARRVGHLIGGADGAAEKGCALIFDYGDDKAFGNSFRAFKNHQIVDPFQRPGECDLTANVDFAYIKEALAESALSLGPLSQAEFLTRMGLQMRVGSLKRVTSDAGKQTAIQDAADRLVDETGMGQEYKVLGVVGKHKDIKADTVWPFVAV